jgi:hypothetical protein
MSAPSSATQFPGRQGRLDFGEQNVEALPYPPATGFRRSAPSPMKLTDKPLRAFRG